jgi:NAD+ diphosphatase
VSPSAPSIPRAPFAFIEGALDRADALRDDPEALAVLWPRSQVLLLDEDGRAWADADQRLYAPKGAELEGDAARLLASAIFLGLSGGIGWFASRGTIAHPQAPQRVDLRSAASLWPAFDATAFAQARAVLHWHARHRYCGACGGEIDFVRAGWLGRCRQCHAEHYPRTDQAIIAAVTDGTRLLLGRQAEWPTKRYSVLAGFVEPGESLEQTVAREVLEESGVRVRGCRYLASQPWPFPSSLMLGFMAQAEPDDAVAGDELEDVRWFSVDEVREGLGRDWNAPIGDGDTGIALSPPISISRWLIEQWLAEVDAR